MEYGGLSFKKIIMRYAFLLLSICALLGCSNEKSNQNMIHQSKLLTKTDIKPPVAKKVKKELVIHGDTRIDNYYWMNERDADDVISALNAENAYSKAMLAHTEEMQKAIFDEIVSKIKKDDSSYPYLDNNYLYKTTYKADHEYPFYQRKKETDAEFTTFLDANKRADKKDFYSLGNFEASPDNKLMATCEDFLSRRIYQTKFFNIETGEYLDDVLENCGTSLAWTNDSKTLFYIQKDETLRGAMVYKHILGTAQVEDELIFEEKDDTYRCFVDRTLSGKYIIIGSSSTVATEFQLIPADNPQTKPIVFNKRRRDHEYSIDHSGKYFYIKTNQNAKNFKIMRCNENDIEEANWEEFIPHRSDVLLEDVTVFKDYLIIEERKAGIPHVRIMRHDKADDHYVTFREDAYSAGTSINAVFDTDKIRLYYTSLTTPNSTLEYNLKTKSLTTLKEQEIIGDFNKDNYRSERILATAKDGTKVPISLVHHKDTKLNGSAPTLLYGYGSYGYSLDVNFRISRLSLLDRGFVFAIAHIRGGEEMGRHWYEDGKLLNKMNTFTDFIDCGEHLIANKYAKADQLFASGGSAGGLLMGAVTNMRPDLWAGILSAVPFVDVVTTMLDESIPLTTGEYDEWGNPNEKVYYDYMKSYSPVDNIEAKDYCPIFVTTGYHDSQVQYWEPAKYVAKMRELKTDPNPLLFHCTMTAGHSGKSGRFEPYKELAMEYAFILDLAGKINPKN